MREKQQIASQDMRPSIVFRISWSGLKLRHVLGRVSYIEHLPSGESFGQVHNHALWPSQSSVLSAIGMNGTSSVSRLYSSMKSRTFSMGVPTGKYLFNGNLRQQWPGSGQMVQRVTVSRSTFANASVTADLASRSSVSNTLLRSLCPARPSSRLGLGTLQSPDHPSRIGRGRRN